MNFKKHFAATLAAAGVLLGAASASAVSFTVVIDKIEVMENGTSPDRITIYHPAANIGEAATRTLDLLNANKVGTALPVRAPNAGTYRTMLVTFGEISVAAETATVSDTTPVTFGTTDGFGTEFGRQVLVMGDVDPLAGIGLALGGVDPVVPMQPIVSTGGSIALPAFNFFLRAADVAVNNGQVGVTRLPVPISVARNDVDSNLVPNVTIGVKGLAFDGAAALPVNVGNFNVKVGLFRSALDLKPVYMRSATIVSNSLATAASITEVTFVDVADGTYLPLAWLDANNNNLLDSGEATIMADIAGTDLSSAAALLTIDKAALFGTGAAGVVSSTSAAFDASDTGSALGTLFGGATANGYLGQSGDFYAFPAREISISIAAVNAGAASITYDNNAYECDELCGLAVTWAGGPIANATADATLNFSVNGVTTPVLTVKFDKDGSTGVNIDDGDVGHLTLAAATAQAASSTLLTYSASGSGALAGITVNDGAVLTISPVPLTSLLDLDVNVDTGFGEYSVGFAIQARDDGDALGDIDTGTITHADVVLDANDAAGHYNNALRRVRLVGPALGGSRVMLSGALGN
ncbi:MAG: hypothetical protein EA405_11930 [Rhodospirillales bacterium]|nr:MAG: hypothetical protein EA405_11930 [Rhodospirillales bacterium]